MDAIKTYLDNIFAAFPQTERVRALKREMLAGMEEKYHALKQEGKSEHEAVGSVIANFGSIDEIAAELGVGQSIAEPEDAVSLSGDEADDYLFQTKRSGIWVGIGVWLVLTGVCAFLMISSISPAHGAMGIFVLLAVVAVAVAIFIMNGLRMERFEHYTKQNIRLDMQDRAELEQQLARFMPRFTIQIIAGIASILLAVGMLIFLGELGYEMLPLVLLLLTVGFAAFLFITAGTTKSGYDVLLGKGDYSNKTKNNKAERIIGTVASVYWPLMVAIYLLWSFIGDAWGISWLIWPVAGILFGAFAGGVSTWLDTKEK